MAGLVVYIWPKKAFRRAAEAALVRAFEEEAIYAEYARLFDSSRTHVKTFVKPSVTIDYDKYSLTLNFRKLDVCVSFDEERKNGRDTYEHRVKGGFESLIGLCPSSLSSRYQYTADPFLTNLEFTKTLAKVSNTGTNVNATTDAVYSPCFFPTMPLFECIPDPLPTNIKMHVETDEIIKLNKKNASVWMAGSKQLLQSTGTGAYLLSNGCGSHFQSSGDDATIICSGTDIGISSCGNEALICESGRNVNIKSSGNYAQIFSSGAYTTITSEGANASISFSGLCTKIKAMSDSVNDDMAKVMFSKANSAISEFLNKDLPDASDDKFQWVLHHGFVRGSSDQYVPLQDQDPQDYGRMITLIVSSGCIVDAFQSAFKDVVGYVLIQNTLAGHATTSNSPSCLSEFFPEFSTMYPGASVEANLRGSQAPTASFSDENLKLTFPGSAVLRALLPDGSTFDCLTTDVTTEVNVRLELKPGHLKGNVASIIPMSIAVVETTLASVSQEALKNAFDHVVTVIVREKFEEICQRGIPLPRPLLPEFEEYENVAMSTTADGFLRMDADITFRA